MKILKDTNFSIEKSLEDENDRKLCWDDDFYGGACGCDD